MYKYKLYGFICNTNLTPKLLKLAFSNNFPGATIIPGMGSYENKLLKFLGLDTIEKEMILLIAQKDIGDLGVSKIKNKFNLNKKNTGILFSLPVLELYGSNEENNYDFKGESSMNKKMIITIVNKDIGNDVIDVANSLGAKGATIFSGRGGGSMSSTKLFNFEIEPQKDVVLIITEDNIKNNIITALRDKLSISEPNKGIIFVLDLEESYGLIE